MRLAPRLSALSALMLLIPTGVKADLEYVQTNLISNLGPASAPVLDGDLRNPWGVSFSGSSPMWVSNQGTNTATLYSDAGGTPTKLGLTVTIPTTSTGPQGPTGQVNNGTGGFVLSDGNPASFIFANLNGTISGWNFGLGTNAEVKVPSGGAVYTGLALATVGGNPFLYAANSAGNAVEVYNGNFQRTNLSGNFTDPNAVAGFSVHNVQAIGNSLFVAYGNNTGGVPHPGGYVDEFDLSGNFLRRIATNGPLNDPWGLVRAPAAFGPFGGDLLVGNLFDSKISAYDLSTPVPTLKGQISTSTGFASPVGLWSLAFGNGVTGDPNTLYFTSGINDQRDGLFAALTPVPEPASIVHAALALLGGSMFYASRRWRARRAEG